MRGTQGVNAVTTAYDDVYNDGSGEEDEEDEGWDGPRTSLDDDGSRFKLLKFHTKKPIRCRIG